ncbi:MAG: GNAT family N-acetyltransferase [Candidatus Binatia bacterium]
MVTSSTPLVERLDWDSEFFGREIGRARVGRLDAGLADRLVYDARAAGLACVYLAAAAEDFETVVAAERIGCHLVDVRVVLERPADPAPPPPAADADFRIGPGREDDLPRLEAIATDVARASRYSADPRFRPEETERLYRTWIQNGWNGYVDAVLVAHGREGEVLGFVCPKMHGELCDLQLVGVASAQRQRKVGRGLISAGIAWARERGAKRLQVVTQGRNVPAQRLYQQLGFLTTEVKLFYHLWLTPADR